MGTTDERVNATVARAIAVAQQGRGRAEQVLRNFETQAAAMSSSTNTPEGLRLLVATDNQHQEAMSNVISDTKTTNAALASELGKHAAQYRGVRLQPPGAPEPHTPVDDTSVDEPNRRGGIQTIGFGPKPEAPFIPGVPTEPWEYNLDLTSPIYTDAVPSIDDVWNELNRCFNCSFPMGGAPRAFPKVGDELPLEIRAAGQRLGNFPVRVTQIQRTADDINIEFVTLPGHVDGAGSTIHFRFFQQDGKLHLGIRGYMADGPGAEAGPIGAPERIGYTQVAKVTWQPFIDRLTENIKLHPSGARGVPS